MTCFLVSFVIGLLSAAVAAFMLLPVKWILISLYGAWLASWVVIKLFDMARGL
jgi:hypothetical protein